MKYIISTATHNEHFGLRPGEFREALLSWSARESFDEVCNYADPAGTWQEWEICYTEESARAEMARIRETEKELTYAFKSPITGSIGYSETVFKLERDNEDEDDPNQIELLDWYAEGFEHEPEGEGSEE